MSNPTTETTSTRRIVLVRRKGSEGRSFLRRGILIVIATLGVIGLGLVIGFRISDALWVPSAIASPGSTLTKRVNGGLYALEIATPAGQARWMLEFDAEIVTKDGPTNPLQLRDALEKLVIAATSIPVVNMSPDPSSEMRTAMLAIAAEHYPWLIDIYMRRSDIRANKPKLSEFGNAIRSLSD